MSARQREQVQRRQCDEAVAASGAVRMVTTVMSREIRGKSMALRVYFRDLLMEFSDCVEAYMLAWGCEEMIIGEWFKLPCVGGCLSNGWMNSCHFQTGLNSPNWTQRNASFEHCICQHSRWNNRNFLHQILTKILPIPNRPHKAQDSKLSQMHCNNTAISCLKLEIRQW